MPVANVGTREFADLVGRSDYDLSQWYAKWKADQDAHGGYGSQFWNDLSGITDQNRFSSAESRLQREWEGEQAGLARDFNSAEAQKQRDWETMMSNTAFQRQVADMKAAGINPAMAHMTSGASTPQGSSASAGAVPNGSAAHSAGGGSGGIFGLLVPVIGAMLAKTAAAKIMAKASSAHDAASLTRTVTAETMRAQAAAKLEESRFINGSKAYWTHKGSWKGWR